MALDLEDAIDDLMGDLEWALSEIDKHNDEYGYMTDPLELRAAKDGLFEVRARLEGKWK